MKYLSLLLFPHGLTSFFPWGFLYPFITIAEAEFSQKQVPSTLAWKKPCHATPWCYCKVQKNANAVTEVLQQTAKTRFAVTIGAITVTVARTVFSSYQGISQASRSEVLHREKHKEPKFSISVLLKAFIVVDD